jgi:uncharacterized 2Fe-2S/4Fe-4S cluster protein (DUF4445 family)
MPFVRFLPVDLTVEVPPDSLIHEAAIREGLQALELPCGGLGTCGQCLVELPEENDRLVLACQTRVTKDLVVRLCENSELAMRVVGDSHFLVNEDLLPDRASLSPLSRSLRLNVPPASIEEHYSDWTRLVREITRIEGPQPLQAPLAVLRDVAASLRDQDGKVTVALEERGTTLHVRSIHAGHAAARMLGLAIDIGTTTVAAQLVDLDTGGVLATKTSYNSQIRRGGDVISRIDYARNEERLAELRTMVLETINGLISELTVAVQARPEEIQSAFVAGNTAMIHLLLGLSPQHIRETPYVPTVNPVPVLTAQEVGLAIDPEAVVECAPGVGSYVGGDITAGLLCTDFAVNRDEVHLFLDIGTNGEIVIGNADWMVACACSAGPAFEGSGIKCGMRASEGAIEHVEFGSVDGSVRYKVIGGGAPAGICGSGLICLLGELFKRGIVDQSGRLNSDSCPGRIVRRENRLAFLLEAGSHTVSGEDLTITEADIENLIRTKAAIYAACSLILESVGLDWSAISRVYIAGGFGRYLQVADAVLIGMLPDLPHGRFRYIGNSALTGAYIALLSREHRRKLAGIAAGMTYMDLSSDPRYMDSYVKAMFLPHTDMERFPTVARMLSNRKRNEE